MHVAWRRWTFALRAPLVAAWGTLSERSVLEVAVRFADGVVGRGECAPLDGYDPWTLADAELALRRGEHDAIPHVAGALATAELDAEAQRAGVPMWRLLGGADGAPVAVNATLGALDRAGAFAAARAAVQAGFTTVKVKVGVGDDAGRLAAVRAAVGPDVAIRADANGAWTVEQAIATLRALEPVGLELVEEPVHGAEALAAVRLGSLVPVAGDETFAPGAVDVQVLRVGRCGGPRAALAAAAGAPAAYLSSAYEGPLGVRCALHVAAALRSPFAHGLATLAAFTDRDPFPPRGGRIAVP